MSGAALLPTDKIQARHRERQAIVYVRQSTVRQVLQHQESTRLQYALSDRARQLGWSQDQVVVIDDDLGRSAASTLHRPGFQRLVDRIGIARLAVVGDDLDVGCCALCHFGWLTSRKCGKAETIRRYTFPALLPFLNAGRTA